MTWRHNDKIKHSHEPFTAARHRIARLDTVTFRVAGGDGLVNVYAVPIVARTSFPTRPTSERLILVVGIAAITAYRFSGKPPHRGRCTASGSGDRAIDSRQRCADPIQ